MPLCFVVDDHVDTREGFAEYLRQSGFDVETAADAGELRSLLEEMTPAAVLMDVQMPLVDGWTLTREIKANERTRDVRVVVVSAAVGEGLRRDADAAGADALIGKPCDPQRIVVELTRLLDGSLPATRQKVPAADAI
ncbi:MAG TPA: response regulator [Vicinamibacterales bacterium]|jgi:CheY-like chemotaxis protein|nr:response regulator [Vicinamibacterales bacterium]